MKLFLVSIPLGVSLLTCWYSLQLTLMVDKSRNLSIFFLLGILLGIWKIFHYIVLSFQMSVWGLLIHLWIWSPLSSFGLLGYRPIDLIYIFKDLALEFTDSALSSSLLYHQVPPLSRQFPVAHRQWLSTVAGLSGTWHGMPSSELQKPVCFVPGNLISLFGV